MIAPKPLSHFARVLFLLTVFLSFAEHTASGQDLAPPSARDIWQIGQHELEFLNSVATSPRGFHIDAYTQYLGADDEVVTDSWNVARVSWGPNGLAVVDLGLPQARPLLFAPGAVEQSWWRFLKPARPKSPPREPESPLRMEGVAPMIFPDSGGIGTDRYFFQYLGVEDLGALQTWTFLLKPRNTADLGAFSGKIWVAGHDIVRFSGTFVNPAPRQKGDYLSFDSIRFKAPSGRWLPWRTYLDQTGLPPSTAGGRALRARISVWGFNSQATSLSGLVGIQVDHNVDAAHIAGGQSSSEDVYLEAESNLLRWLTGVGLMAPVGNFEQEVCDPIIRDIVDANHITLDRILRCRTLLTMPAETALFESVIGVSRTVFDLAPNSAAVAVLIAREVALARVRNRHLDLAWGRPDTLLLNNELNLIKLVGFAPTQTERDQADDLAMEYLARLKAYKPQDLETAAIFLYTASEACKTKPSLLAPRFGDGLPGCGRDAHISKMALAAPPGADQNPAMHIGSRTDVDPWSDAVRLHTAQQEHAPFRVVPEPMLPEGAADDPDRTRQGLVQPAPLPHWTPPAALAASKRK